MKAAYDFRKPPVIETVLGVQFSKLSGFTSAHPGVYWHKQLDTREWRTAMQVAYLEDQFESFGDEREWKRPGIGVSPVGDRPDRIQIVHRGQEKMIQIQDTRFIYNWRKRSGPYPKYENVLPEFLSLLEGFKAFATSFGWAIALNQWEVVYVNHFQRGDLWHSPSEWSRLLPLLVFPDLPLDGQISDSFGGQWSFVLPGRTGRLYVSAKHGKAGGGSGPEVLILQLTARGRMLEEETSPRPEFDLGHEAIVNSFGALTTREAHEHWGVVS